MKHESTPKTANRTSFDSFSLSAVDGQLIGQAILEHLQLESSYLDRVIACGNQMTHLLNQSSLVASRNTPESDSTETPRHGLSNFHDLQSDLLQQFKQVSAGRTILSATLAGLANSSNDHPTLSELSRHLDEAVRANLLQLRNEIRNKLHEAQVITVGNQAVLTYTLDFYHRLLTGFTGETRSAHSYNANGQLAPLAACHLVETNC